MKTLLIAITLLFISCSSEEGTPEVDSDVYISRKSSKTVPKIDSNDLKVVSTQNEEDSLKQLINALKTENELLKNREPIIINKLSYTPKRPRQIQEILNQMYINNLNKLTKQGYNESILSDSYRQFFDIDNCNPLIVEFIDNTLEVENLKLAKRFRLTINCMSDTIVEANKLITFK
jgi:hypothetical protein